MSVKTSTGTVLGLNKIQQLQSPKPTKYSRFCSTVVNTSAFVTLATVKVHVTGQVSSNLKFTVSKPEIYAYSMRLLENFRNLKPEIRPRPDN